jgi:hypothetical protein
MKRVHRAQESEAQDEKIKQEAMQQMIDESTYKVKFHEDSAIENRKGGPFYISKTVQNDQQYEQALLDLSRCRKSFELNDTAKAALSVITDRIGTNYLLLIQAAGTNVSGKKQMTQSCLSTLFSLGMVTVQNVDYLASILWLIDTERNEVIWTNSGAYKQGNITSKKYYEAKNWGRDYLYHLPAKKM